MRDFSLAGVPSSHTNSFSQTLRFVGNEAIPRERDSCYEGKIIPQRDDFPCNFYLGGKVCLKICLGLSIHIIHFTITTKRFTVTLHPL